MSGYTDYEHERALAETLYWAAKQPATCEEQYEYGEYHYRLKDYREAVVWYKMAAQAFYIPAVYKLAYCRRYNLGTGSDAGEEAALFRLVLKHDEQENNAPAWYRLGMCLTYGFGTPADERAAVSYFNQAITENSEALYELGLYYRDGKGDRPVDPARAAAYFRAAYDGFCEEAIFALFAMHTGDFAAFPYRREIREAYSFKLGRLLRVAELNPCAEYLNRLAAFYRRGYPGDSGEKLAKFQRLAEFYYKKAGESHVE
jgi:FOG: TPR repeat, SEL1 subfamily